MRLWIANEWVDAPGSHKVINPYDGSEVGEAPLADHALLRRAVDEAHKAFQSTRKLSGHERADTLQRVVDGIKKRAADFARMICAEGGKPIALAEGEVARAIGTLTLSAEEARKTHGEVLSLDALAAGKGHVGLARRFPRGVVLAITPFNFPLNLVAHKLGPCLATGNTMVLKPSSKTPLTAFLLAGVLEEAKLPAGQVNVVGCETGDIPVLMGHESVRHISFTGSPAVGWKLKGQYPHRHVTLELGGNAGVIVHEDADLASAIPMIATGAFSNAGQSCISVQRIVLHAKIYDEAKSRLLDFIRDKVKVGDPRDPRVLAGPMIDTAARDKVMRWIESARSSGARVLCGGELAGVCLAPTLLEDVPPAEPVCAEEVFAPVATLHRYQDFDGALALVNASKYGLQAGVFTNDLNRVWKAFETLEVGGVLINQVPTFRSENMPYGGAKESGFGREGVAYAMEEMTELRSLQIKIS